MKVMTIIEVVVQMARIGALLRCSPADDEFGRPESCLYGCCEHLHSLQLCEDFNSVKTLKSERVEMTIDKMPIERKGQDRSHQQ
jgi:hypothetical protein